MDLVKLVLFADITLGAPMKASFSVSGVYNMQKMGAQMYFVSVIETMSLEPPGVCVHSIWRTRNTLQLYDLHSKEHDSI